MHHAAARARARAWMCVLLTARCVAQATSVAFAASCSDLKNEVLASLPSAWRERYVPRQTECVSSARC
jgi:hypothetical protein